NCRVTMGVRRDADRDGDLAGARTSLSLLGYLAADDEHGGLAADVSRPVPAAEQPEPRHAGLTAEARRAPAEHERRAPAADQPGGARRGTAAGAHPGVRAAAPAPQQDAGNEIARPVPARTSYSPAMPFSDRPPLTRDCSDCGLPDGLKLQNYSRTNPRNIPLLYVRSEERRVGQECRSRWWT